METVLWDSSITRGQLRDVINQLESVHQIPGRPRENLPSSQHNAFYNLSAEREKEIVSNFAFLSAISDNHLEVMAACIEETPCGKGMIIRIASNTGCPETMIQGFRRIANILEKAATRENSRAEDIEALFRQIVTVDISRILSRLRSRHAPRTPKTIGKPALASQLMKALNDPSVISVDLENSQPRLFQLQMQARSMHNMFTQLEAIRSLLVDSIQIEEFIRAIVTHAYEITKTATLDGILSGSLLDPSLKKHLPEAIGKVGRYYSAAVELVCAARDRECRVFEKIRVEPYQVDIPRKLRYHSLKVHAEIQLLFYYEINQDRPKPRTICSSKSACYLCNLYFEVHGGFYTPRTHGRLYKGWVLPDWLGVSQERQLHLRTVIGTFKLALEDEVRKTKNRQNCKISFPNESVLTPFASWPSSVRVSQQSPSTIDSSSLLKQQPGIKTSQSISSTHENLGLISPPAMPSSLRSTESPKTLTTIMQEPDALSRLSLISIEESDLPYAKSVYLTTPLLQIKIGTLSIILEFVRVTAGRLYISRGKSAVLYSDWHKVNVRHIPTSSELVIPCSSDKNVVGLKLMFGETEHVNVAFYWEEKI